MGWLRRKIINWLLADHLTWLMSDLIRELYADTAAIEQRLDIEIDELQGQLNNLDLAPW